MALIGTSYNKLSELSNWRFYLNAITNFNSYKSNFEITYTYSYQGTFDISLTFVSTNTTFSYLVWVNQCKNEFFYLKFILK